MLVKISSEILSLFFLYTIDSHTEVTSVDPEWEHYFQQGAVWLHISMKCLCAVCNQGPAIISGVTD